MVPEHFARPPSAQSPVLSPQRSQEYCTEIYSGEILKHTIPCFRAELLRWLRHLDTGGLDGGLSMADSAFVAITDETITDEQTLRAALASRAKHYYHTPDAAPDAEAGEGDNEQW